MQSPLLTCVTTGNVRRQAIALEQDDLVQYQRRVYTRDIARIEEWVEKDAQFLREEAMPDDQEGGNGREAQVNLWWLRREISAPFPVSLLRGSVLLALSCNCSPRN